MPFLTLPSEIVARILAIADPPDIRRCQQVCRRLRDLVAGNQYLQYILELDVCDHVVPPISRLDLGYSEKINGLREHRAGWRRPVLPEPMFILQPPGRTTSTCFVDGTFAWGLTSPNSPVARDYTRIIHFDQLPSWNKGTEHTHWSYNLGLDAVSFIIYPKQDLLVLLEEVVQEPLVEAADVPPTPSASEHFRMHLRTMSTNQPHPAVTSPLGTVVDLNFSGHAFALSQGSRKYQMQIYDRLIAVAVASRFRPDWEDSPILQVSIRVIDWISGSEVSQIKIRLLRSGSKRWSFGFLSEEYFVVARSEFPDADVSPAPESHAHIPLGYLDVYNLSSSGHKNRPVTAPCIASLALPDCQGNQVTWSLELLCPPAWTASSLLPAQPEHSAQIFHSVTGSELLVMKLRLLTLDRPLPHRGYAGVIRSSVGTLHVFTNLLWGILSRNISNGACSAGQCPLSITPWETWSGPPYAFWFNDTKMLPRSSYIWGRRAVGVRTGDVMERDTHRGIQLVVSDFSPNRMKAQRNRDDDKDQNVLIPYHILNDHKAWETKDYQEGSDPVPSEVDHELLPCIRTCLDVGGNIEWDAVTEALIDDEHVAIRVVELGGERAHIGSGIFVCTI